MLSRLRKAAMINFLKIFEEKEEEKEVALEDLEKTVMNSTTFAL